MIAHTSLPWQFFRFDHSFRVEDSDDLLVAIVIDSNGAPQNEANARLITAAPELLEALRNLAEGMRAAGIIGPYLDAADSAIAKATG